MQLENDNFPVLASDHVLNNVDCLRYIFAYLNLADRRSVELSCTYWRRISLEQTPLESSVLTARCERDSPARFRVSFSGCTWSVRFVPYRHHGEAALNDENTNRRLINFFQQLFSTYGYAISAFNFGGAVEAAHRLEEAFSEYFLPHLVPGLFPSIAHHSLKSLTSVSLRSISIGNESWAELADMVTQLSLHGHLESLCLHEVSTSENRADIFTPFVLSTRHLRKLALSCAPYALVTLFGQLELDEDDQERLDELSIEMSQHYMVMGANQSPDVSYLACLRSANKVHLQVHVHNFLELSSRLALMEAFRIVDHRVRVLDMRLYIPSKLLSNEDISTAFDDILSVFDALVDTIEEFRLYGSERILDNDRFAVLMGCLSTAPNLKRLSLGKVCSAWMDQFGPLKNLIQVERLYLGFVPKLKDVDLVKFLDGMVNLKRLWIKEAPLITSQAVLSVLDRLEAFEISRCQNFRAHWFFKGLLQKLQNLYEAQSAIISEEETAGVFGSLEFVRIGGCNNYEIKCLMKTKQRFEKLGVYVKTAKFPRGAVLILKNYKYWKDVKSIALPWYNCHVCGAETSPT